ncbi:MAG: thermonuclease family protein [Pseudomonadota bacterium]
MTTTWPEAPRRRAGGRALMARCVAWMLFPLLAHAFDARVVSVEDGDSLTVVDAERKRYRVRLAGADAPEWSQPFGDKAKTALAALVFGREVEVAGGKTDSYGRIVAKVMASDPHCNAPACPKLHDVGLMQVMAGMAWWYRQYAGEQTPREREDYAAAEFAAKTHRLGLWADGNPVPPWTWRRR